MGQPLQLQRGPWQASLRCARSGLKELDRPTHICTSPCFSKRQRLCSLATLVQGRLNYTRTVKTTVPIHKANIEAGESFQLFQRFALDGLSYIYVTFFILNFWGKILCPLCLAQLKTLQCFRQTEHLQTKYSFLQILTAWPDL